MAAGVFVSGGGRARRVSPSRSRVLAAPRARAPAVSNPIADWTIGPFGSASRIGYGKRSARARAPALTARRRPLEALQPPRPPIWPLGPRCAIRQCPSGSVRAQVPHNTRTLGPLTRATAVERLAASAISGLGVARGSEGALGSSLCRAHEREKQKKASRDERVCECFRGGACARVLFSEGFGGSATARLVVVVAPRRARARAAARGRGKKSAPHRGRCAAQFNWPVAGRAGLVTETVRGKNGQRGKREREKNRRRGRGLARAPRSEEEGGGKGNVPCAPPGGSLIVVIIIHHHSTPFIISSAAAAGSTRRRTASTPTCSAP